MGPAINYVQPIAAHVEMMDFRRGIFTENRQVKRFYRKTNSNGAAIIFLLPTNMCTYGSPAGQEG
jgi:hypothetical protein